MRSPATDTSGDTLTPRTPIPKHSLSPVTRGELALKFRDTNVTCRIDTVVLKSAHLRALGSARQGAHITPQPLRPSHVTWQAGTLIPSGTNGPRLTGQQGLRVPGQKLQEPKANSQVGDPSHRRTLNCHRMKCPTYRSTVLKRGIFGFATKFENPLIQFPKPMKITDTRQTLTKGKDNTRNKAQLFVHQYTWKKCQKHAKCNIELY